MTLRPSSATYAFDQPLRETFFTSIGLEVPVLSSLSRHTFRTQRVSSGLLSFSTHANSFAIGTVVTNLNKEADFTQVATGMLSQHNSDKFPPRGLLPGLKRKVGLAAALRINLNIDVCSVVAPP